MTDLLPAVILAGGLATRMGGGDKCLRALGGRPILAHVIERLRDQCVPLALNANGDPARFADFGIPVLPDPVAGHPGPLAGVLAGLDWAAAAGQRQIVTVAADTPFFPPDLASRLRDAAGSSGIALAATRAGDGDGDGDGDGPPMRHPTFGLWPVALRDDLRAALGQGMRKVALWADRHGAGTAVFETGPVDPFFNINTPEDMAEAERLLARLGPPDVGGGGATGP